MTGYEQSAQAERAAFAQGAAQDAAAWEVARQIARTADARERFLAEGDGMATDDPLWLAFQTALSAEMRLRREYFDAFGVPYDEEVA
jgi:head-tail adaptor